MKKSDGVSLDIFERQVYSRSYDKATNILLYILAQIERQGFDLYIENNLAQTDDAGKKRLICRFVAAITSMLSDPAYKIEERVFYEILSRKRYLSALFSTTPLCNMDHIMDLAGQLTSDGQVEIRDESALFKMLLACTLYTDPKRVVKVLESIPNRFRLPFWLSLLDSEVVLEPEADLLRNKLLSYAESLQKEMVSNSSFVRLVNLWMGVSYFSTVDKHQSKKHLNSMIRSWMAKNGVKQPVLSTQRAQPDKPRLLVISENFASGHAMHRCYGRDLEQLRSSFHVILFSEKAAYDTASGALFDEIIAFDNDNDPINKIIGKIIKAKADIIYYPSIGMRSWVVAACQLRLAPIQLMTMGHPATSMSETIDYAFIKEPVVGDPECFSEMVILTEGDTLDFTLPISMGEIPKREVSLSPGLIKIAVPSVSYKINPTFIDACKAIVKRSNKSVEFHFFPNMAGVNYFSFKVQLEKILPCVCYETSGYKTYLKNVSQCDIQVSPFPFGNTNGYVDGLLLGLPIVSLDGRELHSRIDNFIGGVVGLPDYCLASTVEEYIEGVVHLVENDSERVALAQKILDTDLEKIFFSEGEGSDDFGIAVNWVYRNHEEIQKRKKKCWKVADRELVG